MNKLFLKVNKHHLRLSFIIVKLTIECFQHQHHQQKWKKHAHTHNHSTSLRVLSNFYFHLLFSPQLSCICFGFVCVTISKCSLLLTDDSVQTAEDAVGDMFSTFFVCKVHDVRLKRTSNYDGLRNKCCWHIDVKPKRNSKSKKEEKRLQWNVIRLPCQMCRRNEWVRIVKCIK